MVDVSLSMARRVTPMVVIAAAAIGFSGLVGVAAARQSVPDYGIDFVTITHPGNVPYTAIPGSFVDGRGSVPYEYRIGRFETTTAEWLEYYNTFSTQAGINFRTEQPLWWGATIDINYRGPGERFVLGTGRPNAGMIPLSGLNWRSVAMYCNWLNNGKPTNIADIQYGAYDTSTFTRNPDGTLNDQRTHSPGALFWIPTLDEALKAAYYDPQRYGLGREGWWEFNNGSDIAPVTGLPPPGAGETSAGLNVPQADYHYIPLGSYTNTMTPWGLFDASGGSGEWTEETFEDIFGRRDSRTSTGSAAGPGSSPISDQLWRVSTMFPLSHGSTSVRIASAIPTPSMLTVYVAGIAILSRRRSRPCVFHSSS